MTPEEKLKQLGMTVAEEVWKWRRHEDKSALLLREAYPYYWFQSSEKNYQPVLTHNMNQLMNEVNSWSGFGRTLEAISLMKDSEQRNDTASIMRKQYVAFLLGSHFVKKTDLIKATHLAALEAVRKEKRDAEGS